MGEESFARILLNCKSAGASLWAVCDKDGLSPLDQALRSKSKPLLKLFMDCEAVKFSKDSMSRVCTEFVAAMGLELDVRTLVNRFPAGKLNVVLRIAQLFQASASADQQALLADRMKDLRGIAVELLDRMEMALGDRIQRRRPEGHYEGSDFYWR
eukprot:tig00020629_g12426.t1